MLILLDIDGVMVPATSRKPSEILSDGFLNFTTKAIYALNNIIGDTNATVGLNSEHIDNIIKILKR